MADHGSSKMVDKNDRKLALLIVDVQKKFILNARDSTLESARTHMPVIQRAIDLFRKAGRPVIWILYEGETTLEGITDETRPLLDGFEISDGDRVVIKRHMNSFNDTDLADIAHSEGCDAVLISGMFAQYCVMSTYWGAFDHELSPYMLKGGLISTEERFCDIAEELCKTYTLEELERNLELHKRNRSARFLLAADVVDGDALGFPLLLGCSGRGLLRLVLRDVLHPVLGAGHDDVAYGRVAGGLVLADGIPDLGRQRCGLDDSLEEVEEFQASGEEVLLDVLVGHDPQDGVVEIHGLLFRIVYLLVHDALCLLSGLFLLIEDALYDLPVLKDELPELFGTVVCHGCGTVLSVFTDN